MTHKTHPSVYKFLTMILFLVAASIANRIGNTVAEVMALVAIVIVFVLLFGGDEKIIKPVMRVETWYSMFWYSALTLSMSLVASLINMLVRNHTADFVISYAMCVSMIVGAYAFLAVKDQVDE